MIFTARVAWDDVALSVYPPATFEGAVDALERKAWEKHNGYLTVSLSLPHRARTTGEKSQNHAINGYVQQICVATGNQNFAAMKMLMKVEAIGRGYPFDTMPDGSAWPRSEAEISTVEADALIETIKQLAAEWNIALRED